MNIIVFEEKYRDDTIFMVMQAKDALGCIPRLKEDLLDIREAYLNRGDMFWIALDENDRVTGCIGTKTEGDDMWLKRLYVKPSRKRQGIGTQLLRTAERFSLSKGIHTIKVHLGGKEYFESYSFYPKHGYRTYAPRYMEKQI